MTKLSAVSLGALALALVIAGSGAASAQTASAQTGPEVDKAAIARAAGRAGLQGAASCHRPAPIFRASGANASNTTTAPPARQQEPRHDEGRGSQGARREPRPTSARRLTTTRKRLDGLLDGKDLKSGRGYNAFWIDPATTTQTSKAHGVRRGSSIRRTVRCPPSPALVVVRVNVGTG